MRKRNTNHTPSFSWVGVTLLLSLGAVSWAVASMILSELPAPIVITAIAVAVISVTVIFLVIILPNVKRIGRQMDSQKRNGAET